jgi:secretion/DNA translocation related TadE-like protein
MTILITKYHNSGASVAHAFRRRIHMNPIRAAESRECGTASVLALFVIALAVLVIATIVPLLSVFAVRAHVANAADVAALAAADTVSGLIAGYPCDRATQIAAANTVTVESCVIEGTDVFVTASTTSLFFEIVATSHAGPPRR